MERFFFFFKTFFGEILTTLEYSAPSVSKELLITFYPWYNFYLVLSLTVFISQLSFHSVTTKTTLGFLSGEVFFKACCSHRYVRCAHKLLRGEHISGSFPTGLLKLA